MMTSPPATDHNQSHGHGHSSRVNDYFPSSSSSSSSPSATASTTAAAVTTNTFGIIYDTVTVTALNGKTAHNHNQSNINSSNINHHNKRLRTGSISGRLRTASDLEEAGLIDKYQKGIVKDMIIGGDPGILNVLDKFNTSGDTNELKNDLMISLARRPSIDVDLLEGLDFEFLNSFSTNIEYEGERSMSQVFDEDDDEPFDAFFHASTLASLTAATAATGTVSAYAGASAPVPARGGPAAALSLSAPSSSSRPPLPPAPTQQQQQHHRNQRGSSLGSLGDLDLPESPGERVELSAYEALARSLQLREKTSGASNHSSNSSSERRRRRSSTLSHGDELAAVDAAGIDSMEMDEFFEYLQGAGEEHHHPFLLADLSQPLSAQLDASALGYLEPQIESSSPRGKPKKKSTKGKADSLAAHHVKVKVEPSATSATPTSEADNSGRTSRSKVRAAAGGSKLGSPSPGPGSADTVTVSNSSSHFRGQRDAIAGAGGAGVSGLSRASTAPAAISNASAAASAMHPGAALSSGSAVLRSSGPMSASLSSPLLSHQLHASQHHHHHHPGLAGSLGTVGGSSSSQLTARLASHNSPATLLTNPGNKSVRPVLLLPSTQTHLQSQLQHSSGVPTAVLPSSLVGTGAPGVGATGSLEGYVGAYSAEQRRLRVQRFVAARTKRVWTKKVKYDVRKNFADSRIRVKGRFVKKEDEESLRDPPPSLLTGSSLTGLPLGMGSSHSFMQCQGQMQGQPQSGLSMGTGLTYSLPSLSMSGFGPSMPHQPLHHISPAHSLASSQQHAHLGGQPGGSAAIPSLNHHSHSHPAYAGSSGGNSNSSSNISSSVSSGSCSSAAVATVAAPAAAAALAPAPAAVSKGSEAPQPQPQPQSEPPQPEP